MAGVETVDVNTGHTGNIGHPYWSDDPDRLGAEMTRGWPYEKRPIKTTDALGQDVEVHVGFVHDHEGRLRLALGIGDGPTALLGAGTGAIELLSHLHHAVGDLLSRGGS